MKLISSNLTVVFSSRFRYRGYDSGWFPNLPGLWKSKLDGVLWTTEHARIYCAHDLHLFSNLLPLQEPQGRTSINRLRNLSSRLEFWDVHPVLFQWIHLPYVPISLIFRWSWTSTKDLWDLDWLTSLQPIFASGLWLPSQRQQKISDSKLSKKWPKVKSSTTLQVCGQFLLNPTGKMFAAFSQQENPRNKKFFWKRCHICQMCSYGIAKKKMVPQINRKHSHDH